MIVMVGIAASCYRSLLLCKSFAGCMLILCVILGLTSILSGLDSLLVETGYDKITASDHICIAKAESMLNALRTSSIIRMLLFRFFVYLPLTSRVSLSLTLSR
jgi:hypothetical protein